MLKSASKINLFCIIHTTADQQAATLNTFGQRLFKGFLRLSKGLLKALKKPSKGLQNVFQRPLPGLGKGLARAFTKSFKDDQKPFKGVYMAF